MYFMASNYPMNCVSTKKVCVLLLIFSLSLGELLFFSDYRAIRAMHGLEYLFYNLYSQGDDDQEVFPFNNKKKMSPAFLNFSHY